MKVNKELLKGSTVILILTLIDRKPMYGYEIIKEIESRSNGVFNFKEGTLYPILHSLEMESYVVSYWDETESSRKRKYYKITEKGKLYIKEKQEEWTIFKTAVDNVMMEEIVWN